MVMKVSHHIEAPVEKVFDHFMDLSADSGMPRMEVLEAKATKEGVGTFMTWRVKLAGIPWTGLEVVTGYERNKHITEQSSSAMVGTWEYSFEPEGTGTKVTLVHRPRGLWAVPPLGMLVDYTTTRLTGMYVGRTKAKLEAGATVPTQRKPAPSRKPAASR